VKTDLILVGGGLANSLIAWRLNSRRPEVELLVLERDEHLGGRHTWSFHEGDLTPDQHAWMEPLVARSWSEHEVRFPSVRRRLRSGYHSVTSERLREVVGGALGKRVRPNVEVKRVSPREVVLDDGTQLTAEGVIDGRGDPGDRHLELGFQKFLGLTLELEDERALEGPILMDATVPQSDGFRFVYTLPFSPRRMLVEDTRYADEPALDQDNMRREIRVYARQQGWPVAREESEEIGALPIVLAGDIEAFWDDGGPGVARSGMRAALFHPTTGYSLPEAVRLADAIAASADLGSPALYALTRRRSREAWGRGRFFRLLNRMLYRAAEPDKRYRVLEHFYRLPDPLVARFYAGHPTWLDRLRVLSGRPPVPVGRAIGAMLSGARQRAPASGTERESPR
jgi:lycopene beta-cyclase